ncbi:MAG: heme-binding protein [Actinomycetota bacterium]|nr:heme-binding protein [Actinomycetota bacterium]
MAAPTYDELAQNVLQAALRKADELGVPSSVAVVDERRELVAFARQTVAGATQAPGNARGGRAGHPVPRL